MLKKYPILQLHVMNITFASGEKYQHPNLSFIHLLS